MVRDNDVGSNDVGVWQWSVLKTVCDKEPAQSHERHACHAKRRSMSPSATPATQSAAATRASTAAQARHQSQPSAMSAALSTQITVDVAKRRKVTADVAKCHACHAKRRWMPPSATPATQSAAVTTASTAISAAPATQSDGRRHQVPRLPRKVPRVGKLCVCE